MTIFNVVYLENEKLYRNETKCILKLKVILSCDINEKKINADVTTLKSDFVSVCQKCDEAIDK